MPFIHSINTDKKAAERKAAMKQAEKAYDPGREIMVRISGTWKPAKVVSTGEARLLGSDTIVRFTPDRDCRPANSSMWPTDTAARLKQIELKSFQVRNAKKKDARKKRRYTR